MKGEKSNHESKTTAAEISEGQNRDQCDVARSSVGRRRGRFGRHLSYRFDKTIAAPCKGFDKAWTISVVSQCLPQFADCGVQPDVKFDVGVYLPQPLAQLLTRDNMACIGQELYQYAQWLLLKARAWRTLSAQCAFALGKFEQPETKQAASTWQSRHRHRSALDT
jgi:hypothetical protein